MREPEETVFLESGMWSKPTGATWVLLEARGADGGRSAAGMPGEPGETTVISVPADEVPEQLAINVGRAGCNGNGTSPAIGHGWARVTAYFDDLSPETGV